MRVACEILSDNGRNILMVRSDANYCHGIILTIDDKSISVDGTVLARAIQNCMNN